MKLLRFIPIKLTIVLVLGILLGKSLDLGIFLPSLLTAIFLCLLGILFYRDMNRVTPVGRTGSIRFGIVVALTTFCIGLLAVSLADPKNLPDHYSHHKLAESHLWTIKIREVLKSTSFSDRYVAHVEFLGQKRTSGSILLAFYSDSTTKKLKVDDELIIHTVADTIRPPLNPYQFNYKKYMKGLGITHQLRMQADNYVMLENPETTRYGMAASVRSSIIGTLKKAHFGEEELSIIQALLLGQRNDISAETYNNYKNAGAVHILAVSGLHIGILLLLLQFLLRPLESLPKGRKLKLAVIVVLLWGFALLAGLSASVVRAVTMFSFVAYALYLNRPSNTFNILALSMFFILLVIDPMLLFQVGFQMSYAAVFAIVWIYPLLQRLWHPKNTIVRYFWQLLSVSIAAQLGVLPISLFYFHQFPGLFFISNLLVVPALGLILGMGILVIALALIDLLPDVLVLVYDTLIRWMNTLIAWVAQQEAFVFRNISFDTVQLVLAYIILICLVLFVTRPNFKKIIALGLGILGFQLWSLSTSYNTRQREKLFLAHQTRNSVLIHHNGNELNVAARDTIRIEAMITDYQVAERIVSASIEPLKNSYLWQDKKLLIVDSLGIYPNKGSSVDYLLLTQSPKLNLKRLIDSIRPKMILADGSNYRSYVDRWRKTCEKRKLPFHYTGEKGAYFFELQK